MLHGISYQQLVVAYRKVFVVDDFFICLTSWKFVDELECEKTGREKGEKMKQISAVREGEKSIKNVSRATHCSSTKHNLRHLQCLEHRQHADI